jgi:hypothetical protein
VLASVPLTVGFLAAAVHLEEKPAHELTQAYERGPRSRFYAFHCVSLRARLAGIPVPVAALRGSVPSSEPPPLVEPAQP